MRTNTMVTVACVLCCLLAGCGGEEKPVNPQRPVWKPVDAEQDDTSSDPADLPSSDHGDEAPDDTTTNRNRCQTLFRLASDRKDNELGGAAGDEADDEESKREVSELCVRLVGCTIAKDAPARKDDSLNHPPKLYVVVKKGNATEMTSSEKSGWEVIFADNRKHSFNVTQSENAKYFFEILDSQWGNDRRVTAIGPVSGKEFVEQLLPGLPTGNKRKQKELHAEKSGVAVTLECVGAVRWCRLVNVTIPTDSPCRKPFGDEKPELEVRLFRDGKPLENVSEETTSTCLPYGWEGTFPKSPMNCWPILERSDARYDVEVWDVDESNELLFKVSNLQGEKFRDVVLEKAGPYVEKERLGKVQFQFLDGPITEE